MDAIFSLSDSQYSVLLGDRSSLLFTYYSDICSWLSYKPHNRHCISCYFLLTLLTTQRHRQRYPLKQRNSYSQAKHIGGELGAVKTQELFVLLLFPSLPHSMENTIVASEEKNIRFIDPG